MKNTLRAALTALAIVPVCVAAGGDPDYVKYPADYAKTFTQYATINRANQTQLAKLYANEAAVAGFKRDSKGDPGAVVVMEIYTPKKDTDGKPIAGSDGLFEIDTLAAIGVMEKRADWDAAFPTEHRSGDWGFALYNPDGSVKSNELSCAQCHTPLQGQDYLFTYQKLIDFVK
ncbi:MAG: cytochrome P460 family protein [Nitrosomonas sp.]|nr:MAG: cytochrome P460 family protein [Nitrosomonas sp.]